MQKAIGGILLYHGRFVMRHSEKLLLWVETPEDEVWIIDPWNIPCGVHNTVFF